MPPVAPLTPEIYGPLVRAALAEDVGSGDITTEATVPATAVGRGILLAKSALVVAGLDVAEAVFQSVNGTVTVTRRVEASNDRSRNSRGTAPSIGHAHGSRNGETRFGVQYRRCSSR